MWQTLRSQRQQQWSRKQTPLSASPGVGTRSWCWCVFGDYGLWQLGSLDPSARLAWLTWCVPGVTETFPFRCLDGRWWHDLYDVEDKGYLTCGMPMGSSKSKKRLGRKRKMPKITDCSLAVIACFCSLTLTIHCSNIHGFKCPLLLSHDLQNGLLESWCHNFASCSDIARLWFTLTLTFTEKSSECLLLKPRSAFFAVFHFKLLVSLHCGHCSLLVGLTFELLRLGFTVN